MLFLDTPAIRTKYKPDRRMMPIGDRDRYYS